MTAMAYSNKLLPKNILKLLRHYFFSLGIGDDVYEIILDIKDIYLNKFSFAKLRLPLCRKKKINQE